MKIVHVNNKFHFLGGTEQYLYNICSVLRLMGHKNIVLHDESNSGTHFDIADKKYAVPFLDNFDRHLRGKLQSQIKSIVNREKPDLIYLHNIHNPYVVEVLTDLRPVVKYVHDHELYCPKTNRLLNDSLCRNRAPIKCIINAFRGDGYRCMGRRTQPLTIGKKIRQMLKNRSVHRKIEKFIVASQHMKQNLLSFGYHRKEIEILPYFTEICKKATPKNGEKTILFVGRIFPEKGIDLLINSLSLLKENFHFMIIGDGNPDYVNTLHQKIERTRLDDRTTFVGWIDNCYLDKYYNKAALLVVPSLWPEPFGIVGIEAMSHGLPVVAFNVGGISEWLEDNKTGFLIERGDINTFAQRVDLLLKDRSLRIEFGQNAYQRALTLYNKENHIKRLVSIFYEVINS
ncbi:MAG: glycosyltransferase family 4 protein [Candidatus Hodarchaeota archaeon]